MKGVQHSGRLQPFLYGRRQDSAIQHATCCLMECQALLRFNGVAPKTGTSKEEDSFSLMRNLRVGRPEYLATEW